jgi:hypothetical protein
MRKVVLLSAVLAGSVPSVCGASEAIISQVSSARTAMIEQVESARILKASVAPMHATAASGPALPSTSANPSGNFAQIVQQGSGNDAAIMQSGAANSAVISQVGRGNSAIVVQRR